MWRDTIIIDSIGIVISINKLNSVYRYSDIFHNNNERTTGAI